MSVEGAVITIIGGLDAFPRRLAARELSAHGAKLRRGISRGTDVVVVGHKAVESWPPGRISARIAEAKAVGASLVSENGFLRRLGLLCEAEDLRQLTKETVLGQSGLDAAVFELLVLFDAFGSAEEPFGFRDLLTARQFARLHREGVDWTRMVRAVRAECAADGGFAKLSLEAAEQKRVLMRVGEVLTELDGQHILSLETGGEATTSVDDLFEAAETAEENGEWARAAALYGRCLELEPDDPVIPFNLSHVLLHRGEWQEARRNLLKVLRLDPGYSEAWYNLAAIARDRGDRRAARRHLQRAIAEDPEYPDPIYNLAHLEYEEGDHGRAHRLWKRYLELDPNSQWSDRARHGLQLTAMLAGRECQIASVEPPARPPERHRLV
jgi:tetratricopeptide (TPR) repeat protein